MKRLTLSCEFTKNLFVVLILVVTAYSAAAVNQLQLRNGNFNVSWNYVPASQEIEFEVKAKTTGHVALGLTKTNSGMQDLTLFAGGVDSSGSNYLKEYKATGTRTPQGDSHHNYTLVSASESNGVTTVRCKRKLNNTQDAEDQLIKPGDPLYIAWAYHTSSDNFQRHSYRDYSHQKHVLVPNTTPEDSDTTPKIKPPPTSVGTTSDSTTIGVSSATQKPTPAFKGSCSVMLFILSLVYTLIVH